MGSDCTGPCHHHGWCSWKKNLVDCAVSESSPEPSGELGQLLTQSGGRKVEHLPHHSSSFSERTQQLVGTVGRGNQSSSNQLVGSVPTCHQANNTSSSAPIWQRAGRGSHPHQREVPPSGLLYPPSSRAADGKYSA